ncbi:S8 family serine peptidase [Natronococcus roseus]|uniref:S8 family serine peptidase n=1 Tax=Natronococcus roseus TaxID=1052014 RepID=UPI00374CCE9D
MSDNDKSGFERRTVLKGLGAAGIAGGMTAGVTAQDVTPQDADDPAVDSALADLWADNEMVKVVLRLERLDRAQIQDVGRDEVVSQLQAHAEATQEELRQRAEALDEVRVANTFWLANAMVLKVRTDEISPNELAGWPRVRWVHRNVDYQLPEPASVTDVSTSADDVTYGLEQLNVPEVWDELDVTGAGSEVAVLDTGINADHPDFAAFDPDNWQEFDGDGNPIDSEPFDDNGHGSHVAGTTAGPLEPDGDVPAYGVAPDAELWHGKVLDALGGGTFDQIVAGMEWAVDETTADIIGMSLGGSPSDTVTLEATEHIADAGVILSASNGNDSLSTPGAFYSSFGSQAIDENYDLAEFAVGEWIEPEEFFDDPEEIPDYWADEYVTPTASAAGVDVLSLYPDEYAEISGTSMSQPHKAGAFALMVSASGELDREWFWETMVDTAWQPEQAPSEDPNAEYGHGVIDALEATQQVALDQGVTGTVTDTDDSPIGGADVTVADPGTSTQTDDDGVYDVLAEAGDTTVTAEAFGYEEVSHDVTVPEGDTTEQDFDLPAALAAEVVSDQPAIIEGGETITTTLLAAHPETVTVSNTGGYGGELALTVDGEDADLGEPVALDGGIGEVEVSVETEADTSGGVELEHTFDGAGETTSLTTGPTEVVEELVEVAVIDDTEGYGDDWVAILEDELADVYEVEHVDSSEALEDIEAYDAYFVHGLDSDEWYEATDEIGTIYTAQNLGPDTLSPRAELIDDPDDVTTGTDLATWEITETHEILEDVAEPGDEVEIHTDTWDDGASFGDTDADVYAEAADDANAFAVDEERSDVLLTAIGIGWVGPDELTDDALAIVANAVAYVAAPEDDDWELAPAVVNDEQPGIPSGTGADLVSRLDDQLDLDEEIDLLTGEEAVDAAEEEEYNTYVVNSMETEFVEAFDEQTGDEEINVVWLDQRGRLEGIAAKATALGNPETTDDGRGGGPGSNPELEIVADHPIFDGVGDDGDSFQIHDAHHPDRSWFDGYDGDVVGEIHAHQISGGGGVGIDDGKSTVLLSSFASSGDVTGSDYSEDADTVLGNAVKYLVGALEADSDAQSAMLPADD